MSSGNQNFSFSFSYDPINKTTLHIDSPLGNASYSVRELAFDAPRYIIDTIHEYGFYLANTASGGKFKGVSTGLSLANEALFESGKAATSADGLTGEVIGGFVGGAVGGVVGGILFGAPGAFAGGFIGTQLGEYIGGYDLPDAPVPAHFPHNHPIREATINPSSAYVPTPLTPAEIKEIAAQNAGFPAYPEVTKPDVVDPADIEVGPIFGSNGYFVDGEGSYAGGYHVFRQPGNLPRMTSEEVVRLNAKIRAAQKNGFDNDQIKKGIVQGYDLNGPEVVVDFTPVPAVPRGPTNLPEGSNYRSDGGGNSGRPSVVAEFTLNGAQCRLVR